MFSMPFSFIRWHLNAYFFFCASALGSRYSTATLGARVVMVGVVSHW